MEKQRRRRGVLYGNTSVEVIARSDSRGEAERDACGCEASASMPREGTRKAGEEQRAWRVCLGGGRLPAARSLVRKVRVQASQNP